MEEDNQKHVRADKVNAAERAIDPVCGMTVDKQTAGSFEHGGERYFFCSALCLEIFRKDPVHFLNRATQEPEGDLRGILRTRRLSSATMRNIKQNLFWAFIYNALGVPIAAGALYPVLGILLSPMIAAAAMSFSSVSVIGNALRLRRAEL